MASRPFHKPQRNQRKIHCLGGEWFRSLVPVKRQAVLGIEKSVRLFIFSDECIKPLKIGLLVEVPYPKSRVEFEINPVPTEVLKGRVDLKLSRHDR